MFCTQCGHANTADALFCARCGTALAGATDRPGGQGGPDSLLPAPVTLPGFDREAWEAVIGPKNRAYYLPRMEQMETSGAAFRWHWPAFFVTWYWLLYRKMWKWAVLYFFTPVLFAFVATFIGALAGPKVASLVPLGVMLALFLVPPLLANGLYYQQCHDRMVEMAATSASRAAYLARLEARGGTSSVLILVVLVSIIPLIGILAAVALPAYQDYTVRAKTAQAWQDGMEVAREVTRTFETTNTLPETLDGMGRQPRPASIESMQLDRRTGVIDMKLQLYAGAQPVRSLQLVPTLEGGRHLSWSCRSPDIPAKNLPVACRDGATQR
jgi:hypothetical protein